MNIAFQFLSLSCLSIYLPVCLSKKRSGRMPNVACYPVEISSSASCRQLAGWRHSEFVNTHSVRIANERQLLTTSVAVKLVPKKCNAPPIWHALGGFSASWSAESWRKWRINYHLEQIIPSKGVLEHVTEFWDACVGLHLSFFPLT